MYDVLITGGGLAGLINAILLSRGGLKVLLIEKNQYPFHRVCGEYISNEVKPFLERNGLFPEKFKPTLINRLVLSSANGNSASKLLKLGGFGISRYALDNHLYQIACRDGVEFMLNQQVNQIILKQGNYLAKLNGGAEIEAKLCVGAYGKHSRLDVRLQRKHLQKAGGYIGVKYHIKHNFPDDTIALHNFEGGYCGISNVEGGVSNLCYLSTRDHLRKYGNVEALEQEILWKNPHLREIWQNARFIFDKPLVINDINFSRKEPVESGIFMTGDAAGLITPLCGNGMAMAIHSAQMLSTEILEAFNGKDFDKELITRNYTRKWNKQFRKRLWVGRNTQKLFGSQFSSNIALGIVKKFPGLASAMIEATHGETF